MSETFDDLKSEAASLGVKMRAKLAEAQALAEQAKNAKTDADRKAALAKAAAFDSATGNGGGFKTLRFTGLADMGTLFGTRINDPSSDTALAVASDMVVSFMSSFTATTAKTKAGGTEAMLGRVVRCGVSAPKLLNAMQARLDHWQAIRDSANESDNPQEAKAARDQADRFLIVADSPKKDDKGVVVKPARYAGRPATVVNGIAIEAGSGTNRTAQLAQAAALFLAYGDDALKPAVLDALLDNGGKVEKASASVEDTAAKALDAVNALMTEHGGEATADAINLRVFAEVLKRIKAQGFAANTGTQTMRPMTPAEVKAAEKAEKAAEQKAATPPPLPATPPPLPTTLTTDDRNDAKKAALLVAMGSPGDVTDEQREALQRAHDVAVATGTGDPDKLAATLAKLPEAGDPAPPEAPKAATPPAAPKPPQGSGRAAPRPNKPATPPPAPAKPKRGNAGLLKNA